MSKNKRIWIIILVALALVLLIVFISQFSKISDYMHEIDYGEASVQVSQTQNPQEPTQISQTQRPSEDESESETMEASESEQNVSDASSSVPEDSTQDVPEESEQPTQETDPTSYESEQPTQATESATQETELPTQNTQPPTQETELPTQSEAQENPQNRIDELIAMVYALRDEYTERLEQIVQAASDEYHALPEVEKTQEKKQEIALRCTDKAYALEKECDGKIDEICLELGIELIKTDGDMTLINEIRYAYATQKAAAKNELTERYGSFLG